MILAELLYCTGAFVVSLIIILIPIFFGICIIDQAQMGGDFPEQLFVFMCLATLIEWGAILIALLDMFGK